MFSEPSLHCVKKTLFIAVLLALSASGFSALAQEPAPVVPAPTPVAAAAPAAAAARPDAAAPKPFKDVIKDAKEIPGLFKLYQKDEKIWIEIKPEQFEQAFFFTYNIP